MTFRRQRVKMLKCLYSVLNLISTMGTYHFFEIKPNFENSVDPDQMASIKNKEYICMNNEITQEDWLEIRS